MPFLVGFSGGLGFPFYSAAAFPHPPTIIAPNTPHFSLARDVPKPRDADTKTGIDGAGYFGAAGYFFGWDGDSFPFYSGPMLSHVPKAKGCRQKDSKLGILWYRQKFVFWDSCVFWGKLEKVFHFIVVPCCHVPKPKDVE